MGYDGEDYRGLDSITIQGNFTNCIDCTTEVNNFYESDIYSSDVVGLFGVPLEIETGARDSIGVTVEYILQWFHINIDIETAIRKREW